MDDKLKTTLLGELTVWNEIKTLIKEKGKEYFTINIPYSEKDKYIQMWWELDVEFKKHLRIKKPKTIENIFVDSVWSLFAQIGFTTLNKHAVFSLPYDKKNKSLTHGFNVFAVDDETILLIECKVADVNTKWNFREDFEAMRLKIEWLKNSAKFLFSWSARKIKYILVTKNYSLSPEDLVRLKNIGGVHLNEDNIDYFYALYSQLGYASKYQLLGTLFDWQEIPELDNKVPAVEGNMGCFTYYSFCLEPEKLLKIWYVLHRNKANINMMPTYQRVIKKSRLKSVEEFIEGGWYFPNSIVISLDIDKTRFEPANTQVDSTISRVWLLYLPKRYRSAYIIDWQHRLYGYSNSKYKDSHTIPVVAFLNLNREEQIKLFMQINENQKAVSKDLRNTLNADLLWTSDSYLEQMKALCSRISIHLWENRESPLFDKISIGEDKKIITTQAIENALRKSGMLGRVTKTKIEEFGTIYDWNLDLTFDRIKEYLILWFAYISENIVDEWNDKDWMLLINKGVFGIIMILGDLLSFLRNKSIDPKEKSIKEIFNSVKIYLDPIVEYINNLDREGKDNLKSSYGEGWETKYRRTFQQIIQNSFPDFKPDGLSEYLLKEEKRYNSEAIALIRDIETYFKKDFKERLVEFYQKKWFDKWVPQKIANEAALNAMNKNRELDDNDTNEVEAWDCLNIIAYREIAMKNWQNIFEKEYTKPGEEKARKDDKTKWMVKLERIRNQNFHSYSVSEDELSFLNEIHDWIVKKTLRNKYQLMN